MQNITYFIFNALVINISIICISSYFNILTGSYITLHFYFSNGLSIVSGISSRNRTGTGR